MRVPVRGMGLNVLFVPLHKVSLDCELFAGEAALAVRPALPIEGVSVILGNDLAGARMWADTDPLTVPAETESVPLVIPSPDENSKEFPNVFTACVVTRAMTHTQTGKGETIKNVHLPVGDFPVSLSCSELAEEQQADVSLKGCFE